MGLPGRLGGDPPTTSTDYVEGDGNISPVDAEKVDVGARENSVGEEHYPHIHLEAERAVVHKIDLRVIPLVSGLCTEFEIQVLECKS